MSEPHRLWQLGSFAARLGRTFLAIAVIEVVLVSACYFFVLLLAPQSTNRHLVSLILALLLSVAVLFLTRRD
jgi:predicted branched-subunit amino acid permease